jgi:hypothetical protein
MFLFVEHNCEYTFWILLPPGGSSKSYICAFIFVDATVMMVFGFGVSLLFDFVSFLVLVDNLKNVCLFVCFWLCDLFYEAYTPDTTLTRSTGN